ILLAKKKEKYDEILDRRDSNLKIVTLAGRSFEIVNDEGFVILSRSENERMNLTVN
ncbi:MAG: hypothetical protein MHPSP_004931, partial [Paramarteilia canceri]